MFPSSVQAWRLETGSEALAAGARRPGEEVVVGKSTDELKMLCRDLRVKILRMLTRAGSGHPGGSLSCVEALCVLFYNVLGRTRENIRSPNRHRFVLSKGHGVPTVYALFAQLGIIDDAELDTLRVLGSRLQGHPDYSRMPELEASTGSLGQGLSVAQGMALAARIEGAPWRVYCLVGDGECQEGQVWEAFMSAAHHRLDKLTVVIDANHGQIDGTVSEVMNIEPLGDKLRAFGWHVTELADGHDLDALQSAFARVQTISGKPSVIIARTVKGKGVSFMEHHIGWHGVAPNQDQCDAAVAEVTKDE